MKQEYQEVLDKIPEATRRATLFGIEYLSIECNKRRAKNLLLKLGWQECENKLYLKKNDAYIYNNHLSKYLREPLA